MPLPTTGSISLAQVQTEFGGTNPISMNEYYRLNSTNGVYSNPTNLIIPASGIVSMSNFYGSKAEEVLINNTTITNANLRSMFDAAFGAPSGPVKFRFTNNGTIGASSTSFNAFTVGSFPAGSLITIDNNSQILGAGGAANSGNGTAAIVANQSGFTTIINNNSGGLIYGGGGGGGVGGRGGSGSFTQYNSVGASGTFAASYNESCTAWFGGGNFCGSGTGDSFTTTQCSGPTDSETGSCLGTITTSTFFRCNNCGFNSTVFTTGGAGGSGGRGQGYNHSNLSGSGGAAGGTNAGVGGTGGTGGGWGANGNTGNTGGNGNAGSGLAGSVGGTRGAYLIKSTTNVTLNNNGALAGSLL